MRSSTIRYSVRLQELPSSRAQNGFSTQSINNRKGNTMEIKRLRLTDLEINRGQVPGLPSNPRGSSCICLSGNCSGNHNLFFRKGYLFWGLER